MLDILLDLHRFVSPLINQRMPWVAEIWPEAAVCQYKCNLTTEMSISLQQRRPQNQCSCLLDHPPGIMTRHVASYDLWTTSMAQLSYQIGIRYLARIRVEYGAKLLEGDLFHDWYRQCVAENV